MQILSLTAENFKRLKAIKILPTDATVVITGRNAQGKSSVLDSIFAAMGGQRSLPSQPVRKGEQSARIQLELGTTPGNPAELIVTRKFNESGASSVTVEQANGARFSSPQTMLDSLIGSISFDPLEFTRMKPEDQFNTVRKLVKLDVDIEELEGKNAADFERRTDLNREIKSLRAQAAAITLPPDQSDVKIDTAALLSKMQSAGEHNAEIERAKASRAATEQQASAAEQIVKNYQDRIDDLKKQIIEIEKKATEQKSKAKALRSIKHDPLPAPIDVALIRQEIEQAEVHNRKVALLQQRQKLEEQVKQKDIMAEALTGNMNARNTAKAQAIKAAKMPIEGLAFGDKQILFQELPLDQASQAERIRVSMAVAMALNPKLRVLTIKDGSLIDDEGLAIIQSMVKASDYQLWLERVGNDGSIGIVIEDGEVAE